MDFNAFLDGFALVVEPKNLLYCLVGVLIGMVIGVLPGLGPAATIAILLPITYTIDPVSAIIMLAGIYYGAQYGGTITSVLLRLPGEASSVVTVFDGYALAKQGKAGTALGIAAIGSFVGATISIVGLTLLAPVVAEIALDFGPPEYAALALLGVLLVATIGSGNKLKALIAGCLGTVVGHRWPRHLQRRFAFHIRQSAARRRYRLRRGRDGPVRRRRDPLQPRAAARQSARSSEGRQCVAVPQRPQAVLGRDRTWLGDRLRPGRAARRRRGAVLDRGLRHREAPVQDAGAVRPRGDRRRRRTRDGEQRGGHLVVHPPAHHRPARQRDDGDAVRRAADPRRLAGTAAGQRAPRRLLGRHQLDVHRQHPAADPVDPAGGAVRPDPAGAARRSWRRSPR